MQRNLIALLSLAVSCSSKAKIVGVGDDGSQSAVTDDGATANSSDGGDCQEARSVAATLCDGTPRLRLWVYVKGGNEVSGSLVRVENGSPFLAVDGLCTYWIGAGWTEDALRRDREARTGTLTASESATLESGLALNDIAALRDCSSAAGLFDSSVRVVANPTGMAQCDYEGRRFDQAWTVVEDVAKALWTQGRALDGALHVTAVDSSYSADSKPAAYVWPLSTPLSALVVDPGPDATNLVMPGASKFVIDPDSTSRLRALRGRYLADRDAQPGIYANWDGLQVVDGFTAALLYIRDAIPYEDSSGLLHF